MECFICSKKLTEGHLCKEHATELINLVYDTENSELNNDWKKHCAICGEYENRIIIEYKNVGYFCEECIKEEIKRYK